MVRSRIQLVDTLSERKREGKKHAEELKRVENQSAELATALRAADEVCLFIHTVSQLVVRME